MYLTVLFLQAGGLDPNIINMVMFGILMVVFYFFMIRPQAQRQKKQTAFEDSLAKGSQVVTSSGIIGRVSKIDKEAGSVTLEVSKGNYMDFTKNSISREFTENHFSKEK